MFGNQGQDGFLNAPAQAAPAHRTRRTWPLLLAIAFGFGGFVLWAAMFEITEVSRGMGRVVPSSQVQIVQSLEGGILRHIEVEEGAQVEAGQALMHLDDTGFSAQKGELDQRRNGLLAEKSRLEAEAAYAREVMFSEALQRQNPQGVSAETALFLSRRQQLERQLAGLESKKRQREGELAELTASQARRLGVLAPLREEMALTQTLAKRGAVPEIELLRLKSRVAGLEGDLSVGEAAQARLQAQIEQANADLASARAAYALGARQRLAALEVELAIVEQSLAAARDRVARRTITSPARGTLNRLMFTTLGAVVQPGAILAEIVPQDDGLLIEAAISPRDVAFIAPGAPASVKITAYDYLTYGSLAAHVDRISADSITDAQGQTSFRVILRTKASHLGPSHTPLPISPGMIAQVDIQTGRKTVLSYLTKPLLRARAEALRER